MPRKNRRKINRDKVRGAAQERKQSGGGLTTLSLPEGMEFFQFVKGKNALDILPYEVTVNGHPEVDKGDLWYERTFWLHRDVGPEEKVFVCPQKTIGEPCPVCEEYNKLKKDPNADEEVVDSLRPKKRQLFNVVDRSEKGSGEIQLLEVSYHLFGKKLDTELSEDEGGEIAGFADLDGGLTLKVRMTKESMGSYSFLEADRIDFAERKKGYPEDILDDVVDLDKCLKIEGYEKLDAEFNGVAAPEDDVPADVREEAEGPGPDDEEPESGDESGEDAAGDTIPDGAEECTACEGSGKNSKGKTCRICGGEGYNMPDDEGEGEEQEPEPEPEEEEQEPEPEKPKKSKRTKQPEPEPEEEAGEAEGGDDDDWGDDDWGD